MMKKNIYEYSSWKRWQSKNTICTTINGGAWFNYPKDGLLARVAGL
jgi:hypothetical protein